ncbi:response regulator [Prosthecodimorpha staleyi]|uniref:Response regulator transcription factor n=1 Tax=Prosthecodimorpha staleyi TaxID=2840188 RepID=A0A947D1C6_9HYPH|nr:response regulator transcription factor [Prosthecodimorpha staleyi]MBT9288841.1 response regulator transcription factor [Prosthecodimorpha staleyi]
MRILTVEDDAVVAAGLVEAFTRGGYQVDHANSAETAIEALATTQYDLAVIDIGLPRMNGRDLIRHIRMKGLALPVLILSAHDALEERVRGLDLGADDYMVKPFQLPELLARARALIRRSQAVSSSEIRIGGLNIDLGRRSADAGGVAIDLTGREWDILQQLALTCPKVVPKQKMVESLSDWGNELTPNAIEIYVSRLRAKLQNCGIAIRTIRGLGYRLDELA